MIFADAAIDRLTSLADRLDSLGSKEINFWIAHGPDTINGGFYGTIHDNGTPNTTAAKGLIQQCRFLWAFCLYYEMKDQSPKIKKICDNLYAFISTYFVNNPTGDFYYKLNANGTVQDQKKNCYAEAFGILSLAKYGTVFDNAQSKTLAMNCFHAMELRCHDSINGGYNEKLDDNNSGSASKTTNTILHSIEAFRTLYEATHDSTVYVRLNEQVNSVLDHVIQPSHYCAESCNNNWSLYSTNPTLNYGHDMQTSWLLFVTAPAINRDKDTSLINKAIAIAQNSIVQGHDAKRGGYYYLGVQNSKITNFEKIWWSQCEAMTCLWWTYKTTRDTAYLNKFDEVLTYLETKMLSPVNKSVIYWGLDTNNRVINSYGTDVGSEWKANYHTMRAYLTNAKSIRDFIATNHINNIPAQRSIKHRAFITCSGNSLSIHGLVFAENAGSKLCATLYNLRGAAVRTLPLTLVNDVMSYSNLNGLGLAPGIYTLTVKHSGSSSFPVLLH
jgi:mannobiose 2-epimerase